MGKVFSSPRESARSVQRRMSNLGKKKKTDSNAEESSKNKHEEEDDILEDEPPPPQPQSDSGTKGVRRRGAVSAEAVTEEDIANYKKVVSYY